MLFSTKIILVNKMKNFLLLSVISLASVFSVGSGAIAQQFQETQNTNTGSKQTFSIVLTQTHGVTSNVTMTPDYIVSTKANVVVGEGSEISQQSVKGASGSLINNQATNERGLQAEGVSGATKVVYGPGTEYGITITPRITDPNDSSWKALPLSQASGQVLGIASTTLTVDSTSSSFINSFTNTLTK
jgi:hypothetical protein